MAPGRTQLEFWTTPGPLSFLIYAFLTVDKARYLDSAAALGEVLLVMQNDEGGIFDGDRNRSIEINEYSIDRE